ncbi:Rieske 2Fe-2S domain-containing protein [Longispora sp. NPDC051575]|uniref:Rieske 2Fe-2S domain-containing protein n=1 Tax=Longispora sp. NPDC051575 TaxID=3154943 RepID=UPI00342D30DF
MLVVTWSTDGAGNCVVLDGQPYVYARTTAGEFVLPAACPHRGGPLHLAALRPGTTRLVCPWHERATSVTRAVRAGVPAVRCGRRVTAVFDLPDSTPFTVEYRPLSDDLVGGRA